METADKIELMILSRNSQGRQELPTLYDLQLSHSATTPGKSMLSANVMIVKTPIAFFARL